MRSRTLREDRQKPVRSITHGAIHPLSRKSKGRVQTVRELREALISLHDPAAWTRDDAEAFWKAAEKARFN